MLIRMSSFSRPSPLTPYHHFLDRPLLLAAGLYGPPAHHAAAAAAVAAAASNASPAMSGAGSIPQIQMPDGRKAAFPPEGLNGPLDLSSLSAGLTAVSSAAVRANPFLHLQKASGL